MYVVKVSDFLEMEGVPEPHQVLRRKAASRMAAILFRHLRIPPVVGAGGHQTRLGSR